MNRALTHHDQIDMLREENRQLRERIARLTGDDDLMAAHRAFGTSMLQSKVVCYLVARGEARREHLIDHCYPVEEQLSIVDVGLALATLVKHVRKHLRPHGIDFDSVYCLGWEMSGENRRRAREIMEKAR